MSYGEDMILTLFTNDPALAAKADRAGVDRIGVDLETLGKHQRQGHLATWISDHREADLGPLAAVLARAQLFARCNPIHAGSREEIGRLIAAGVEVLMLPWFKTTAEAETFIRLIDGRAYPVLLVETKEAAAAIGDLCRIPGVVEIHVGLNDMRLSLGWPSHFHVLASDLLRGMADTVREAGLRLGVGGLGRAGDNQLPVPSDLVIAQYPRLGAGAALISRAFFRPPAPDALDPAIAALRERLTRSAAMPAQWLADKRDELEDCIAQLFTAKR